MNCRRFGLILVSLWCGWGWNSPAHAAEHVRVDLLRSATESFPGDTSVRNYYFRLPEHITPATGSELNVLLRGAGQLWPKLKSVRAAVNGQTVAVAPITARNIAGPDLLLVLIQAGLPEHLLGGGWNRVALFFDYDDLSDAERGDLRAGQWSLSRADAYLSLAFQTLPLFPELRRFPYSLAEGRLLRTQTDILRIARGLDDSILVLVPEAPRDAHLRACAIVAARLGQVDYLSPQDCKLMPVESWAGERFARNGVLLGTRSELEGAELPTNIVAALAALQSGEGLLAEVINASGTRWIVAAGADDAGLEKAALFLGSPEALNRLSPSPALVSQVPPPPSPEDDPAGEQQVEASLQNLHRILVPDPSLRRTAIVLAEKPALANLRLLFNVAMHLGRRGTEGGTAWPQARLLTRGEMRFDSDERVLLLAPTTIWPEAAGNATLPIRPLGADTVLLQGRAHSRSAFEPTLAFLHLLPPPWGGQRYAVLAGGWSDSGGEALLSLFTNAAPAGLLFGNVAAADATGRFMSFNTRQSANESLAARLQRYFPPGVPESVTSQRLVAEEARAARSRRWNKIVFYSGLGLMALLVAARLLLTWEIARRRPRTTLQPPRTTAGVTP